MARVILDTSLLVDAERLGLDELDALIGDDDDVAVAAVTAAELMGGVELAAGQRGTKREEFVAAVFGAIPIEVYDLRVATAHAALLAHTRREGRPRGAHDLIIAATARARGREVLSADIAGFEDLPRVTFRKS